MPCWPLRCCGGAGGGAFVARAQPGSDGGLGWRAAAVGGSHGNGDHGPFKAKARHKNHSPPSHGTNDDRSRCASTCGQIALGRPCLLFSRPPTAGPPASGRSSSTVNQESLFFLPGNLQRFGNFSNIVFAPCPLFTPPALYLFRLSQREAVPVRLLRQALHAARQPQRPPAHPHR